MVNHTKAAAIWTTALIVAMTLLPSVGADVPHYIGITEPHGVWWLWSPWSSFSINVTAKDLMNHVDETRVGNFTTNDGLFVIVRLDAINQTYQSYVRGDPDSNNFAIRAGEGYYMWFNEQKYMFTWGPTMDVNLTYQLYKGWNLVGRAGPYPDAKYINNADGISPWNFCKYYFRGNPSLIVISSLKGMAYEERYWDSYVYPQDGYYNYNFKIGAMAAYFVWVDKNCSIEYPAAGRASNPWYVPPVPPQNSEPENNTDYGPIYGIPVEPIWPYFPIIPPPYENPIENNTVPL